MPLQSTTNFSPSIALQIRKLLHTFYQGSLNRHSMLRAARNDLNDDAEARAYEQQSVHSVYENISSHFSDTRYKVRLLLFACRRLELRRQDSLGRPSKLFSSSWNQVALVWTQDVAMGSISASGRL